MDICLLCCYDLKLHLLGYYLYPRMVFRVRLQNHCAYVGYPGNRLGFEGPSDVFVFLTLCRYTERVARSGFLPKRSCEFKGVDRFESETVVSIGSLLRATMGNKTKANIKLFSQCRQRRHLIPYGHVTCDARLRPVTSAIPSVPGATGIDGGASASTAFKRTIDTKVPACGITRYLPPHRGPTAVPGMANAPLSKTSPMPSAVGAWEQPQKKGLC